jgi:hypothetical protein
LEFAIPARRKIVRPHPGVKQTGQMINKAGRLITTDQNLCSFVENKPLIHKIACCSGAADMAPSIAKIWTVCLVH